MEKPKQASAVRLFSARELAESTVEALREAAKPALALSLEDFARREGVKLGPVRFMNVPPPWRRGDAQPGIVALAETL